MSALERLRDLVAAEGEPIAGALLDGGSANGGGGPAALAAAGPRAHAARAEYELFVEAIYEGYLLHYGVSRVVSRSDPDLALLAGDRLYAIGLSVSSRSATSRPCASSPTSSRSARSSTPAGRAELAEAVWTAGARAVGWGATDGLRRGEGPAARGRERPRTPRPCGRRRARRERPPDDLGR